jgi:hypothetical protein
MLLLKLLEQIYKLKDIFAYFLIEGAMCGYIDLHPHNLPSSLSSSLPIQPAFELAFQAYFESLAAWEEAIRGDQGHVIASITVPESATALDFQQLRRGCRLPIPIMLCLFQFQGLWGLRPSTTRLTPQAQFLLHPFNPSSPGPNCLRAVQTQRTNLILSCFCQSLVGTPDKL